MSVILDDGNEPVLDTDDDEILDTWDDVELFSPFGLRVEVEFESGTWTDIADEVFLEPVRITRGRQDWSDEAAPARISFRLVNDHGHFTPGNRRSPYWPGVTRGVPVRVIVEHEGTDYTRFVGAISSWHVSWPDGDVSDGDVDHPGVCDVEVEAAGVLQEMQRGPSKTPVVWTMGRRNLFRPDSRRRVRIEPDWRYGWSEWAWNSAWNSRPQWSIGSAEEGPAINPFRFMFHVSSDILSISSKSGFFAQILNWFYGDGLTGNHRVEVNRLPDFDGPTPPAYFQLIRGGIVLESVAAESFLDRWVLLTLNMSGTTVSVGMETVDGASVSWSFNAAVPSPIPVGSRFIRRVESGNILVANEPADTARGEIRWYVDQGMNTAEWGALLQAANGYPNEAPEARLTRILAEGGFPAPSIEGVSGMFMGPQEPATVMDVARDAGLAGGLLVEDADTTALRLRAWGSLANQPVVELDAANQEITVPLDVMLDEQGWVTEVTAKNRLDDQVVVGDRSTPYVPESIDRNVADVTQLASHASWRLHLGTIDDPRAPAITVNLAQAPELISTVADLMEGDIVRIVNLPAQWPFPTLDLMIQGSAPEELLPDAWSITWNTTPGGPWTVGALTDGTTPDPVPAYDARLDTEACELVAAIDEDDTTFDVETLSGPPWVNSTDHPDEFPLLIEVAGEVMTVTAATAPSSGVQTFTVTRGDDARAHAAGTAVVVAQPLIVAI